MNSKHFSGDYDIKGGQIKVDLVVLFYKENNQFIAYCPPLDIAGAGNTEEEARSSFEITLDEFMRYTLHKGTLFIVLESLGWHKSNSRKVYPPKMTDLLISNKELANIINTKQYRSESHNMSIPCA